MSRNLDIIKSKYMFVLFVLISFFLISSLILKSTFPSNISFSNLHFLSFIFMIFYLNSIIIWNIAEKIIIEKNHYLRIFLLLLTLIIGGDLIYRIFHIDFFWIIVIFMYLFFGISKLDDRLLILLSINSIVFSIFFNFYWNLYLSELLFSLWIYMIIDYFALIITKKITNNHSLNN